MSRYLEDARDGVELIVYPEFALTTYDGHLLQPVTEKEPDR